MKMTAERIIETIGENYAPSMIRKHVKNPTSVLRGLLASIILLLPWQTVFLFHVPVIGGDVWQGGVQSLYLTELLVWITAPVFLWWYIQVHHRRHRKKHWPLSADRLLVLSMLIFILYTLVIGVFSLSAPLALQHTNRLMVATILAIMITLGPLGWIDMMGLFVASAIVPALLGIAQIFAQSTIGSTLHGLSAYHPDVPGTSIVASEQIGRVLRAYGPFAHPNVFGGFLVLTLTTSLILQGIIDARDKLRRRILHGSVVLLSMALIATMSRSAWLALLFSAGSIAIFSRCESIRWQRAHVKHLVTSMTLMLLSIMFMITIFFSAVTTRITSQSTHEITSISERISSLQDVTTIISIWPMVGTGAGNYTTAILYFFPRRPVWMIAPIHNVPLLILAEFGVVGSLLFFAAVTMWLLYIMLHHIYSKHDTLLLLFLAGMSISPLLFFDHYLYSSLVGLLLMGLTFGLITRKLIREN